MLPPYAIGFLALCFWWRWWLLVPAGIVAAALAKFEYASVTAADGPGLALGIILVVFMMIGATSGFVASGLVLIGRATRLQALRAIYVLPAVFILGFGSYFAVTWTQQKIREARYAPPAAACLDNLHPAQIADVEIAIPIAPGIFLYGERMNNDHYILWSNPDARAFCGEADGGNATLKSVVFMLDGSPARREMETKRPFCSRPHPEYPWAEMACHLIPTDAIPDKPVKMTVSVKAPGFDPSVREREAMSKNQAVVASDGLRTYRSQNDVYLQRPDGYFARCRDYRSKSQPWLYCTATEELSNKLAMSYDFRTTAELFINQSAAVAGSARAIFNSLKP
ncbi:MFS transporter [Rhizobium laguerreae]|nr:MFS transporter [Rhizobium laguerreae]